MQRSSFGSRLQTCDMRMCADEYSDKLFMFLDKLHLGSPNQDLTEEFYVHCHSPHHYFVKKFVCNFTGSAYLAAKR